MGGILNFFSGKSEATTQETTLPAPTAEETRLLGIAGDVASLQKGILSSIASSFPGEFQNLESEFKLFQDFATQIQGSDKDPNKVLADLRTQQLNLAAQGGLASPEELARIKQSADFAIEQVQSDLLRSQEFAIEGAQTQLRSQGLRVKGGRQAGPDSPILDRASAIVQETQRQFGQAVRGIRGQQAQQELQFPLQRGAFVSGILSQQQGFEESRRNFLTELSGRSLQNRLQLFGARAALTGIPQSASGALATAQQPRLAQTMIAGTATAASGAEGFLSGTPFQGAGLPLSSGSVNAGFNPLGIF